MVFLVLLLIAVLNFWDGTEKFFKSAELAADLRSHFNFIAVIKVLLWGWRDFLGRNTTACLNLSCICSLIRRAYCCCARGSQRATCRRAEAGSCLSPEARRNTSISAALSGVLAGLSVKCKVHCPWRNKPSLTVCKMQHFLKWRGLKTVSWARTRSFLLQLILLFCGYMGKYVLMVFRTVACHSQPLHSNYSGSCCLL